jgi:hypothetical protein
MQENSAFLHYQEEFVDKSFDNLNVEIKKTSKEFKLTE